MSRNFKSGNTKFWKFKKNYITTYLKALNVSNTKSISNCIKKLISLDLIYRLSSTIAYGA